MHCRIRPARSLLLIGLTLLAVAVVDTVARSDEFPTRAITIIVPFPPGGGLFVPAGTPTPAVRKLNAEFVKALQSDNVKDKALPQVALAIPGTPEDLAAMVARDIVRLGKVVRESGAKAPD